MIQIIKKEEDDQRQLHITVEVPEQEVQKELRVTARKLSRQMRFPGFRPGKVPYPVILNRVGEDTLRAEALEDMLDPLFRQVRAEVEEEPYLQAEVSSMELNPMQVSFIFPLQPVVQLGDYRALREDITSVTVTEAEVDAILQDIRERHSVAETVERPADFDDIITVTGLGFLVDENGEEGETFWTPNDNDLLLDNNRQDFGGEFVMHLIGTVAGDEKQFTITLPENFLPEEYAGKLAQFTLSITAVKQRELPDLDDELAQEEGDFETLDELRAAIRNDLLKYKTEDARNTNLTKLVEHVRESGVLIYPPAAVQREIDHRIEEPQEQVQRTGWKWEDYVTSTHQNEQNLRQKLYEVAQEQLEFGLIMRQFIHDEMLRVTTREMAEQANKRLEGIDEQMRGFLFEYLTQGRGSESVANEVLLDKVHERLKAIFGGTAPDLEELRALAEAEEEE